MDVFRTGSTSPASTTPGLRVNLQSINADNTTSVLDEVFSSYGSNFSDKVDDLDAQKMQNVEENLAIIRGGQALMVDRSQALEENDTIQLKLWNTAAKQYQLEFNPVNLTAGISIGYLVDNYLKTSTPVDLNRVSRLFFTVTADIASASPNRFMILFKAPSETAPVVNNKNGIITYPNPINGKTIQLFLNNQPQGTYSVELINGLGQVVYKTQVKHGGGSAIQKLELVNKPTTGVYLLNISKSGLKNTQKIVIN